MSMYLPFPDGFKKSPQSKSQIKSVLCWQNYAQSDMFCCLYNLKTMAAATATTTMTTKTTTTEAVAIIMQTSLLAHRCTNAEQKV